MLKKEQYSRANGMLELAGNSSNVIAPLLAGALFVPLGLVGILMIDLVSAGIAIGTLLFVHIPQPQKAEAPPEKESFSKQAAFGFRYILKRPSLLGLQLIPLLANFFASVRFLLVAPMVLARTGSDELAFASVQTAGAIGGVLGGLVMSAWGGPKRHVYGVLGGWTITGLVGMIVMGAGQALPMWIIGIVVFSFFDPVINASNQAIWQSKVSPEVQGRVFSARAFIAWSVLPLAPLLAGPLADKVFEPAMAAGGRLSPLFSPLVGSGPGSGMGLILVLFGLIVALVGIGGYLIPAIRDVETLLPDHDEIGESLETVG
jgi:hypothetical protein